MKFDAERATSPSLCNERPPPLPQPDTLIDMTLLRAAPTDARTDGGTDVELADKTLDEWEGAGLCIK